MENVHKSSTSIKNWALDDRPREKLLAKGRESLSDSELLAILINTGIRNRSAIDLAREILLLGANNLNELGKLSVSDFMKVNGIKQAKAITMVAALELGRRRQASLPLFKIQTGSSRELFNFLQTVLQDYAYEVFGVVFLNRANKIIHFEIISKGGLSATIADPRIIFRHALERKASSIILCHNHPSGNLKPSQQDLDLTNKLKNAGNMLDIKVLDHLIVSDHGYFSFADEGLV